jgi:Protein of unknown function (DUF732)
MKVLSPAVGAVVAAITLSAPAHADQNGFLKMLADHGAPASGDEQAALLHLGHAVCDGFYKNGWSEQRAVSEIMTQLSDATPNRAQLIVTAAHLQLCADA